MPRRPFVSCASVGRKLLSGADLSTRLRARLRGGRGAGQSRAEERREARASAFRVSELRGSGREGLGSARRRAGKWLRPLGFRPLSEAAGARQAARPERCGARQPHQMTSQGRFSSGVTTAPMPYEWPRQSAQRR